jgi:hypothetical protein
MQSIRHDKHIEKQNRWGAIIVGNNIVLIQIPRHQPISESGIGNRPSAIGNNLLGIFLVSHGTNGVHIIPLFPCLVIDFIHQLVAEFRPRQLNNFWQQRLRVFCA